MPVLALKESRDRRAMNIECAYGLRSILTALFSILPVGPQDRDDGC